MTHISRNIPLICIYYWTLLSNRIQSACNVAPNIVHNWDIASNLDDWTICYNEPYSDITTTSDFSSCQTGDDYYIFLGARSSSSSSDIYVGAYAPSSVLTTITSSKTTAYKPSWNANPSYNVYWYNYPTQSFGFAGSSIIDLNTADLADSSTNYDDNTRLSWFLDQSMWGGYRAGTNILGYTNSVWRKVIYYCNVNGTPAPTSAPTASPSFNPTISPTMGPTSDPTIAPSSPDPTLYPSLQPTITQSCPLSTSIVNNWNIASNLADWTICYNQPYSHGTTNAEIP